MVISRAIIRDLYSRDRIGGMISLVIAVMMIAQMLSPLLGGLIETTLGWRAIFYVIAFASFAVTVAIAVALPETRRVAERAPGGGFLSDAKSLTGSRAFVGYVLCQVLASAIIFTFAGGGPYVVVTQMGRSSADIRRVVRELGLRVSARQCVLRALLAAAFAGEADLVRSRDADRRRAA